MGKNFKVWPHKFDTEQLGIYETNDAKIMNETKFDIQDIEEELESQNKLEVENSHIIYR